MLSHATRYITKGFLDQGLSPQFVDMYEAVNQMVRKKVMDSFESESAAPNAEADVQSLEMEPTMDQTAISIDELWSTLFGLGNTSENDIQQSCSDSSMPSYRF